MLKNTWIVLGASTAIFVAGFSLGSVRQAGSVAHAQAGKNVYELRTYTAPDGKLGDLNARFRNHTLRIFEKHGMKNVLYMTPQDAPDSQNTLIYVLEHPSRDAAKKSWDAFRTDPEWQKVAKDTHGQRPDHQQDRLGVRRSDRLFADEVGGAMTRIAVLLGLGAAAGRLDLCAAAARRGRRRSALHRQVDRRWTGRS